LRGERGGERIDELKEKEEGNRMGNRPETFWLYEPEDSARLIITA
jgi:hypothetical protein